MGGLLKIGGFKNDERLSNKTTGGLGGGEERGGKKNT